MQKHPRGSQETLLESFLQNHVSRNLSSSLTSQTMVQLHQTAILTSSLQWLELAAGAPFDGCWLLAIRGECLKHKPSSISARFFLPFLSRFLNFLLLHPTPSLAHILGPCSIKSLPICSLLLYVEVQQRLLYATETRRCTRTEIKNHDVLLPKIQWELLVMVTHCNQPFTLWWAKETVF